MREAMAWIAASDLFLPLKLMDNKVLGMRRITVSSEVYLMTNSAWTQSMSMNLSKDGEKRKLAVVLPLSAIG